MILNEELDTLARWADALANAAHSHKDEVLETLNGTIPLIEGAPSAQSQALMVFRQIETRFKEVEGAMQRCRAAISAH